MKIAFLLSGQPRFYEKSFPYIKKLILDKYDCDIYAHAWWSEEETTETYALSNWSKNHYSDLSILIDKDFVSKFNQLYKPTKFVHEPSLFNDTEKSKNNFIKFLLELYPIEEKYHNLYKLDSMLTTIHKFFSVERALNMIDTKQNYEWIINWRYDLVPIHFPNLTHLKEKNIYVFTDYWETLVNRDRDNFPGNYKFIDTGFIVPFDKKHFLNIKDFYFNECIKSNLIVDVDAGDDPLPFKHTIGNIEPELIWALSSWFHSIPSVFLPYEEFTARLIRSQEDNFD